MDEALSAALAVLPAWVRWGPLAVFGPGLLLLTAALTRGVVWAATRRLPGPEAHWTIRAAALWPARRAAGGVMVSAGLIAMVLLVFGEVRPGLPVEAWAALAVVSVWAGTWWGARSLLGPLGYPRPGGLEGVRAAVALPFGMYLHLGVLLGFGLIMPVDRPGAWVGLGLVAVVLTLAALGGEHLAVARALGLARPADARLSAVVARAAARAGVAPPPTFVLPSALANALAFPLGPRLAFTTRIVDQLDDAALEAIAAHELEHLTEGRGMVLARAVGACALVPAMYLRPVLATDRLLPLVGLLGVLAVMVLATALVRRAATRMEQRADAAGHRHEGDPGVYAAALERVYAANMYPAVIGGRKVHPDLYDRLVATGVTPDWPRPPVPSAWAPRLVLAGMVVAVSVLALGLGLERGLGGPAMEARLLGRLALGVGTVEDLGALGAERGAAGDTGRAMVLLAAAARIEPSEPRWPAEAARVYARMGDCPAAVDALRAASADQAGAEAAWERGEDPGIRWDAAADEAYIAATDAVGACLGQPPR